LDDNESSIEKELLIPDIDQDPKCNFDPYSLPSVQLETPKLRYRATSENVFLVEQR